MLTPTGALTSFLTGRTSTARRPPFSLPSPAQYPLLLSPDQSHTGVLQARSRGLTGSGFWNQMTCAVASGKSRVTRFKPGQVEALSSPPRFFCLFYGSARPLSRAPSPPAQLPPAGLAKAARTEAEPGGRVAWAASWGPQRMQVPHGRRQRLLEFCGPWRASIPRRALTGGH